MAGTGRVDAVEQLLSNDVASPPSCAGWAGRVWAQHTLRLQATCRLLAGEARTAELLGPPPALSFSSRRGFAG